MDTTAITELLARAGIPIRERRPIRDLIGSIAHLLRGCRPLRLQVFDHSSQRLVEIGRLCRVCGTETALVDGRTRQGDRS